MNVKNRKIIRRLALKSLTANRTRNLVAILAIALTAMLFTTLFTIALSLNEGFQQSNFRQVGGYAHGTFKDLTDEEYNDLKDDPLIEASGKRRVVGMVTAELPFAKSHIELSYCDNNAAQWMYLNPKEGRLPKEGTNEAATDTHVLKLLGVEPKIGATITLPFTVDGQTTEQTFTLCGWWEYDDAITANHILIPESRVDAILDELDVTPPGHDGMTGNIGMDVMLKSGASHIDADMRDILANNGYHVFGETDDVDHAIRFGVNWGYTGAQMSENADIGTIAAVVGMLLLIIFTGYLIIYNVFQISVAGDIRFYGLLKTIGTTPRQLARLIRMQALALSAVGIPLGLLVGWLVGRALVPVVVAQLDGIVTVVSVSPLIFVISAVFALVTVFISCLRPGRKAARVSPIEAVRYTENNVRRKKARRKEKVSLFSMAVANLGRSRIKTVVTVISLGLAVVLLNVTVTFVNGFDMEKYVSKFMTGDFKIATTEHIQVGGATFNDEQALPLVAIDAVKAQGGITDGGVTYGTTTSVFESVDDDYYRKGLNTFYSEEQIDDQMAHMPRNDDGTLITEAQLYGMEDYPLDHLKVLEGDLAPLYESGSKAIAAVYTTDDYDEPIMGSHWAKVGDKVTLRYADQLEYINPATGEVYQSTKDIPEDVIAFNSPVHYREETYTVTAIVTVPLSLTYGYFGDDEFVMNADTFKEATGTEHALYYTFDTTDDANADMETFLADYTENIDPTLDYVSTAKYAAEFNNFRSMFTLLGGLLSFIIGLIGVLNFFNAILTGIASRRRELAMLQSVGMTDRQLRRMLILEGLLYTIGAVLLALILSLVASPFLASGLSNVYWFFSYKFTIWPVLIMFPIFGALGIFIPVVANHFMAKHSIIDRLRQE